MQGVKTIKTGIPELDKRLGGGIPSNAVVLISHQTGTTFLDFAESTLIKQMENAHVIIVNFISPARVILNHSNVKAAFDEENKVTEGEFFSVIDCFTQEGETTKKFDGGSVHQISYPFETDKLYSTMRRVREGLGKNKWGIWVFNTLSDMSVVVSEEALAKFFRRVFSLHKSYNDLAFYLLNIGAHGKNFPAIITQMVDVAIDLRVEEKEDRLKSYMQVVKGVFPIDTKKLYYESKGPGKVIFY
ncbi:MAG: ATPase domain-containing protein [Candidatus Freyarchaeum deiterrae]